MQISPVVWHRTPAFSESRLVMGFSGWMDGGDVSTGALTYLAQATGADLTVQIKPEPFYLYQLPGPIEFANAFRPYVEIEDGIIKDFKEPADVFFMDEKNRLIYFLGKEPNHNWRNYTESLFSVCERCNVKEIYYVGSVAGLVPHTRQPRFSCLVSHKHLKPRLEALHYRFTNYKGPSSIVSYLALRAKERDLPMISLVAEIPAYIQGKNPKCIEAVLRHLSSLLGIDLDLADLKRTGEQLEQKITRLVNERDDLAEHIKLLEENYDKEVFDTEMTDLQEWLQQKGIRLD